MILRSPAKHAKFEDTEKYFSLRSSRLGREKISCSGSVKHFKRKICNQQRDPNDHMSYEKENRYGI